MSAPLPPLPADDLGHVLAHTREMWAEAKGARFFFTGGTGFFGLWLLESFAHANDALGLDMSATVLTRDPAAFARKAPHLAARGDLRLLAGAMGDFPFPAGGFHYVIHAAADTSVPPAGADPEPVKQAIVAGTHRVVDFAVQAGVRKFLLTSSGAVYGAQPAECPRVDEDFVPRPVTGYGAGKLRSEELCLARAREAGFECKGARCFAFVGPHLPLGTHFAIGNFIRDVLRGGPVRVAGDGTPVRTYLYAGDLAAWLWTMLFTAPAGRVYNVGSAAEVDIAGAAHAVAAASVPPVFVEISGTPQPGQPRARYVPSVNRAAQELGLRAWTPLPEAIRKTVDWHRKSANSV